MNIPWYVIFIFSTFFIMSLGAKLKWYLSLQIKLINNEPVKKLLQNLSHILNHVCLFYTTKMKKGLNRLHREKVKNLQTGQILTLQLRHTKHYRD